MSGRAPVLECTIGELERSGTLWLKGGFPCGNTNSAGVGYPQLRPMNISEACQISLSELKYVEPDRDVTEYLLEDGDVVFNNTNSHPLVGKTALWTGSSEPFVLSNHMTIIRVSVEGVCDGLCLALRMQWLWRTGYFQRARRQHVNQASISLQRLRDTPLLLPPLPEQRAIARALKAVQAARDARRRELELERERKAALMEHLFTKGTRGEPTKMTEIGEMPESWEVRRVQDIAAVRGGKRLPKGASFCDAVTAHPYIRVVDLRDGSVSLGGLRYVDETTHATIAQYTIGKRDVYISIAGTIGSVGTVPAILDGANLTENAAKLVVAQADQLDYRFLAAWLGGGSAQSQIASLTMKTSQPKLALSRIRTILVPLPDLDEQERVVGALDAVVARVDALVREATLLDELFGALLEELMTGRLSAVPLIEE